MKVEKKRVFVFGIDGGTWQVLDPLLKKGKLPNLSFFIKTARKEKLISSLPYSTMPAWIDFATGTNSSAHGCYSFWKQGLSPNDYTVTNASDIKVKTFYEILEENGLSCILINLPASYPYRLKKGFIVSSFLNPDDKRLFYPPGLKEEIPELSSYRVAPEDISLVEDRKAFLKDIKAIEETRFAIGKKLFRKNWDFFFYLFSATDWLQHKTLSLFTEKPKSSEVKIFKLMDKELGWFLKNLGEKDVVIIISDHGFKLYQGEFFINVWLAKEGYLKLERKWRGSGKGFPKEMIKMALRDKTKGSLLKLIGRLFLLFPPLMTLSTEIISRLPKVFSRFIEKGWGEVGVSFSNKGTRAFSREGQLIHLRSDKTSEYEKLRRELIDKLTKLKEPGTNKPLFSGVYKTEEIWGESNLPLPDIILDWDRWMVTPRTLAKSVFGKKSVPWHDREGIIVARGAGELPKKIELRNIAPSILSFFGIKPLSYM